MFHLGMQTVKDHARGEIQQAYNLFSMSGNE